MLKLKPIIVLAALVFAFGVQAPRAVSAQELVPMIDGTRWTASSRPEKVAYLIGLNNYMVMEYVSQVEHGDPPPTTDQSPTPEFWEGSEGTTIDQALNTLDEFYASNPNEMETPAIVVLWNELIEPRLNK